jgi:hypothetical protein
MDFPIQADLEAQVLPPHACRHVLVHDLEMTA